MSQLTHEFFKTILKMEGGYQNRTDDTGNWNPCGELAGTNMGVSAVALSEWVGRCVTESEMRTLDQATAFNFYAWYFDKYRLFEIQDQKFAELLMNNAMGSPGGATRSAQRALNALGFNIQVDGSMGQQTINALNDAWRKNPAGIYNMVRDQWLLYLKSINKPQFLDGWIYRLDKYFPALGVSGWHSPAALAETGMLLLFAFIGYKLLKS